MTEENKKEMTIEDLAQIMTTGFDKTARETDKKIDDLAAMVQNGFMEIKSEMKEIRKELKSDIQEFKLDTVNIKADLNKKVDKIEYNTLEYRVKRLEEKAA